MWDYSFLKRLVSNMNLSYLVYVQNKKVNSRGNVGEKMIEKGKRRKRMKMRMGGNKKEERRETRNEFREELLRKLVII